MYFCRESQATIPLFHFSFESMETRWRNLCRRYSLKNYTIEISDLPEQTCSSLLASRNLCSSKGKRPTKTSPRRMQWPLGHKQAESSSKGRGKSCCHWNRQSAPTWLMSSRIKPKKMPHMILNVYHFCPWYCTHSIKTTDWYLHEDLNFSPIQLYKHQGWQQKDVFGE